MVRALYERGIAPDLLIGTSVGALNAAFLAFRLATVATAEELAAACARTAPQRHPPTAPGHADQRPGRAARPLDPRPGMRWFAARHLQFGRLEQAAIPRHLVAFDLLIGTEARLSDRSLAKAVLAAAAIPAHRHPSAGAAGSRR